MTRRQDTILDEAINWAVRLDADDITFEEQQLFLQWLNADPQHHAMFNETEDVWSGFSALPTDSVQELQSYAYFPVSRWHPVHIFDGIKIFFMTFSRFPVRAAAAVMMFIMIGGFYYFSLPKPVEYETATREQKTVFLKDGTKIYLNTKSKIAITMTRKTRAVTFLKGEAFFSVAPHPDWPFVIETGNGEIKVLGTKFNVYKRPSDSVTVSVVKGKVEVSDDSMDNKNKPKWRRNLIAGQEISFRDDGIVEEVKLSNISNAVSWRRGIITFQNTPLIDVISEFNRYSNKKIVLLAPSLSGRRLGGVFNISDIPMSIKFLEATLPIKVLDEGEYIAVVPAH